MLDDVQAIADFYATGRGRLVATLLRRRLQEIWPDCSRQVVLGLGHTAPFLPVWRDQALDCIDAVPSGSAHAGMRHGRTACLVQDDALPFADGSLDRVLMVHAIENAANINRTLRAVWRAMRDDGRLLIVVANRTGLWAHTESTPFADGAPCSTGRIERVLQRNLFRIERMDGALYGPPASLRPMLRAGPLLEAAGRFVTPRLAGVLVVEAVKELYAGVPVMVAPVRVRRRIMVRLGALAGAHGTAGTAIETNATENNQASKVMPCSSSKSR